MKKLPVFFLKNIYRLLAATAFFELANFYSMRRLGHSMWILPFVMIFCIVLNIFPTPFNRPLRGKRLRIAGDGCELLIIFLLSAAATAVYSLLGMLGKLSVGSVETETKFWIINSVIAVIVLAICFWNGIIRVYATSVQLGVKKRVIGILVGWIPIAHLIALGNIIITVSNEVNIEQEKALLNERRADKRLCETKYPILMVHGVFFRDFKYLNYWGRIPKELEDNGATIYYGNHQSAASVEDCGKELADRIKYIIKETGAEKVNVIAHSKGGLDMRYALSQCGISEYVASLTTINTPHRGCEFADYLLSKIPKAQQDTIARTYNATLKKLGDPNPDFMAAVSDLTVSACNKRNEFIQDAENVYYQSIGSKLNVARSGRFPLNLSYKLVEAFDGPNDGLVGEGSFQWGENYRFLTVEGKRGISHGDVIDLNRENFKGFDVREFYVELVNELKEKGF